MIRIDNLTFRYSPGGPDILQGINLHIHPGEYIALIGPNGCGKSTLIRQLNALLLPSNGKVQVEGLDTRDKSCGAEIRRRVGMVFQNPDHQIVGMSVEEDVAFGPGNLALPSGEVRRRVDEALQLVGLDGLQVRAPHTLSGGQKQLLALAGILAVDPHLIVLDEPTSSLDAAANEQVLGLLRQLNNRGIGILHITQDMEEAARAARVVVMNDGRIIADAPAPEILGQVEWLRDLGLAPPRMAELMWHLRRAGQDVDTAAFTLEQGVAQILKVLEKNRSGSNQAGEADLDV